MNCVNMLMKSSKNWNNKDLKRINNYLLLIKNDLEFSSLKECGEVECDLIKLSFTIADLINDLKVTTQKYMKKEGK